MELGLERSRLPVEVVGQVERDSFCVSVLREWWPAVARVGRMEEVTEWSFSRPEIVVAGYPCPPFSVAGSRRGHLDERFVWPFIEEYLRGVRPRFVVLENVPGHLNFGFGGVLASLSSLGFDAEWDCVPASVFGASHSRFRVVLLAYPEGFVGDGSVVAEPGVLAGEGAGEELGGAARRHRGEVWVREPRVGGVVDGVPEGLQRGVERLAWEVAPRVVPVAPALRTPRLRALGNAVVPQVMEWVGDCLAPFVDSGVDSTK